MLVSLKVNNNKIKTIKISQSSSLGIKSYGKVVYVTATLPLVFLIVLTMFVLCQDGAVEGVQMAFRFRGSSYSYSYISASVIQMIFHLSLSTGWLVTFGGYNRSNQSLPVAASSICLIHYFISIVASVFIFGIWGIQMQLSGKSLPYVANSGFNLAFMDIPRVLTQLPATNFIAVMFFFIMFLFCINIVSAFVLTVLACIYDLVR